MSSLVETLAKQLGGSNMRQMTNALGGADENQVSAAISGALPMLLGALANNTKSPEGANALLGALDRDHDGGVLDDVAGFLGRGETSDGSAILGHVLGGRRAGAEKALGQMSGLDAGQAGRVLSMLAPLVLGALGREKRNQGLDATALAGLLGNERSKAEEMEPGAMGLFSKLLDQDGDGDITDDLGRLGTGLLGRLFRG